MLSIFYRIQMNATGYHDASTLAQVMVCSHNFVENHRQIASLVTKIVIHTVVFYIYFLEWTQHDTVLYKGLILWIGMFFCPMWLS